MNQSIKIGIIILVLVLVGFGIYEVTKPKPSSGVGYSPSSSSAVTSAVTSSAGTGSINPTPDFITKGSRIDSSKPVSTITKGQYLMQGDAMELILGGNAGYYVMFSNANNFNLGVQKGQVYVYGSLTGVLYKVCPTLACNIDPTTMYFVLDFDGFLKLYNQAYELTLTLNTIPGDSLQIGGDSNLVLYDTSTGDGVWSWMAGNISS